jgi:hypothetical protein
MAEGQVHQDERRPWPSPRPPIIVALAAPTRSTAEMTSACRVPSMKAFVCATNDPNKATPRTLNGQIGKIGQPQRGMGRPRKVGRQIIGDEFAPTALDRLRQGARGREGARKPRNR